MPYRVHEAIRYLPEAAQRAGSIDDAGDAGYASGRARLRVLIANPHELLNAGLRAVVESRPGWEVIAEATEGTEAIALAIRLKPHVAIVDWTLPRVSGMEVARQIRSRLPRTEVLILTATQNEQMIRDVLEVGARALLTRDDTREQLLAALESLALGHPFFAGPLGEHVLHLSREAGGQAGQVLTTRERNIVKLIAEGHSNKEIGQILNLSIKTVETHRAAALRKLDLRSTADIVRYAIRNQLIEP